ncbi:hypothetical protein, partial [Burkholderia sp. Ac-20344]|uniref:hypothetical protein n=1 Tax=Burkholderia sp. Ac-20344 TaxID=2703890 RepID=UPI00197C6127
MSAAVARARRRIDAIVERRDDRAIVIVRHAAQALLDPAALERHRALVSRHEDELEVLLQPCGGVHDGVRPLERNSVVSGKSGNNCVYLWGCVATKNKLRSRTRVCGSTNID